MSTEAPLRTAVTLEPYSPGVLDELVAFHADTLLAGGRKFPLDPAGVADGITGHAPEGAVVVRERGVVRGSVAVFGPSDPGIGWHAGITLAPDADPDTVRAAWQFAADTFHRLRTPGDPAFLRVFADLPDPSAAEAARSHGLTVERTFFGRRRALSHADEAQHPVPGLVAVGWDEVVARGLTEQVRHVQYVAFLEHFGELSKSPTAWQHHLDGPVFAPELSVAVLAADEKTDTVVGVLLASRYTDDSSGVRESNAHADYIGVLPAWRRRGVAEAGIRHHIALAAAEGYPAVSLGVDQTNVGADRLYARVGYEVVTESVAYRLDV